MRTVMLKFLAGGIAGLLVWAIMEPSAPQVTASHEWITWQATFVLLLGAVIGFTVGGLEGFTRGGKVHTLKGMGLGLVLGAIGATLGSSIGSTVVDATFGSAIFNSDNFAARMPARIVAFIPIGMMLGAGIGLSSLTFKRSVQGFIGGAIGAAISGAMFDPLSQTLGQTILTMRHQVQGEVGGPARAVTTVLMGAMIGLFIGLVERFSRSAWLRLSLGRNEGKEWSIDGARTFLGRSESANVPLFGDPNIAPIHASIDRHGSQYILSDAGSPMGTFVNGQRVSQVPLVHGSQIQIGSFVLQFLMKGAPAPYRGPEAYVGASFPMGGPAPQPGYPQPQYPQPSVPMAGYQQVGNPMAQPMQPMQPMGNPTQVISPAASMPTMAYGAPVSATGGFTLVAIDGPLLGQRFFVAGPMDVGRECPAIPMSFDTAASRKHASLVPAFNGIAVTDAGSTNGTFLNSQRVSQATASPGDMLKIGSTTFRVESA